MPPAGLPGHVDAFAARVRAQRRTSRQAKAVAPAAQASQTPFPIELWWTPTHYGDASADEYAEIKRGLERRRRLQGHAEVGGVGAVQRRPRQAVQRVPARLVPGLRGRRELRRPFYQHGHFTSNGYKNPRMDSLIKAEQAAKTTAQRVGIYRQIQLLAAQGRPDHPVWQGNMIAAARGTTCAESRARSTRRSSCASGSCRSRRPRREGGALAGAPLDARARHLMRVVTTATRHRSMAGAGDLAQTVRAHAARARRADGPHPADARLPAHAGRAGRSDLGVARRPRAPGGGRRDQGTSSDSTGRSTSSTATTSGTSRGATSARRSPTGARSATSSSRTAPRPSS